MLNTSAEFRLKVYDQIRQFKARATITMAEFANSNFQGFRYIRDWTNGSTANANNYWNAIKVFNGETDYAQGIAPTSNTVLNNPANITDGNNATYAYAWAGNFYAQIDLGLVRYDVDKIQVIHYYLDGRTFHNSKIEVSADGVEWTVLRDSAVAGEYAETSGGMTLFPNTETVRTYDDNTIVRMNILEEMSTLNENLPSNELTLTMTNETGDFNLLNFSNMSQVLASKPIIETELGLLLFELKEQDVFKSDFVGKVLGSKLENPNVYTYKYSATLPAPTAITVEATQTHYDRLASINNSTSLLSANAGYIPYACFSFDVIEILTRRYGEGIWMGETDLAAKVLLAEKYIYKLNGIWTGYGKTSQGNTASLRMSSGTYGWFGTTKTHTSATSATLTLSTYSVAYAIGLNGTVELVVYSGLGDAISNSEIRTDFVELEIIVNPFEAIEWLPAGKFFLTSWNNEITNKIITMVGNDYFSQFSEMSYEPMGITNLKDLAIDVLTKGGVPAENQIIDDSLAAITVNPFPERLDTRTALQHIGIAARSAVGQDRKGNVFIKPFVTIDEVTNYITYPTTQPSFFGYVGSGTYIVNNTGGGMKYLDFGQMYTEPKVSIEKSISQLVVKVFSGIPDTDPLEIVYLNEFLNGTSGSSFMIENPLVNSTELADKIAIWFMKEINYNAIYEVNWRQNPALECADIILVEDSFSAEKQTRIIRQEFNYEGFLQGVTESRGGV